MPPDLDVYVLTPSRDKETLERFVNQYVDREKSEDRGDEELMMLPMDVDTAVPTHKSDLKIEEYDWEPAYTLSHILERGLQTPPRAFAVYLKPIDDTLHQITLCFTVDNQLVLGLSFDDAGMRPENEARAKKLLNVLMAQFKGDLGLITVEEPPPFSTEEFLEMESATLTVHFVKA